MFGIVVLPIEYEKCIKSYFVHWDIVIIKSFYYSY